jgi:hypothetical protein
MPLVKIDNQDYELDSLSDACRAQLSSIQMVDQELARLNGLAAALQTARAAYAQALKAALPPIGATEISASDAIKFS